MTNSRLDIISYNLWDYGNCAERQQAQLRFLREQAPDVLCVQEIRDTSANNIALPAVFATLKDALNMHGEVVAAPRSQCHLGVLWRPNIGLLDWRARPWNLWHGLGIATLDIGAVRPLRVAVTHLSPWDPEHRLADARTIAALLAKPDQATIVGADWNSLGDNPAYDPEPDWSTTPAEKLLHHAQWSDDPHQPYGADRRPARLLTRAGLTDAAPHLASAWQPTSGHIGNDVPRRIDAFRVSDPVLGALTDYQVLSTAATRTISDHLPIKVTIDATAIT